MIYETSSSVELVGVMLVIDGKFFSGGVSLVFVLWCTYVSSSFVLLPDIYVSVIRDVYLVITQNVPTGRNVLHPLAVKD